MNCQDVQARLSEYLDQSLDSERIKLVGHHLEECEHCRVGYAELLECVEQVKYLPVIDPPLGFAQRVMAHAAEIELRPTLWQRILAPWQGKAPIQAVAVVAIAVLAVFIYQKDDRFERTELSHLSSQDTTAKNEIAESQSVHNRPPAKAAAPTLAPVSREVKPTVTSLARAVETEQIKTAGASAPVKAISEQLSGDAPAASKRTAIPVQEVSIGRSGPRLADNAIGFGGLPFNAPRQSMSPFIPNSAGLTTSAINEPTADVEFVVRRRHAQRLEPRDSGADDASRRRFEAEPSPQLESASRDNPPAASPVLPSVVEIRWFSVAPEHLDQFRKELGVEAMIESEAAAIKRDKEVAARFDKTFAVKVIILPPAER